MTTTTNTFAAQDPVRQLAYASAAVAALACCRGAGVPDLSLKDLKRLPDLVTGLSSADDRTFYLAVAEVAGAKVSFRGEHDEKVWTRPLPEMVHRPVAEEAAESVQRYWPAIAFIGELLMYQGWLEARVVHSIMKPALFAHLNRHLSPRFIPGTNDGQVVPFCRINQPPAREASG